MNAEKLFDDVFSSVQFAHQYCFSNWVLLVSCVMVVGIGRHNSNLKSQQQVFAILAFMANAATSDQQLAQITAQTSEK